MNIVLIGFMGSGKSAVGRALARRLDARLLDTDAEIERAAGKTIAEIFMQDGETSFRAWEAETLHSLIPKPGEMGEPLIIATGGGTPLRPENAALLAQIGPIVWLDASPETVLARVEKDLHERPLLASSAEDPATRIRALLAERGPQYAALARHRVETTQQGTSEEVAERIIAALAPPLTGEGLGRGSSAVPPLSGARGPATVQVDLGARSYDILVENGVLARTGPETARVLGGKIEGRLALVVSNPKIAAQYGPTATQSLASTGFSVQTITLLPGETKKNLRGLQRIYQALYAQSADRHTVVVALGGGVVGDMAGFAAATYTRGLPLVQIPTTLLAQVDSSVGGKTGVNFASGKNLIGSFYQPRLVLIDPDTLRSLPRREVRSGLAEVIKYGIIYDKPLFEILGREMRGLLELTSSHLNAIIARSCEIKARVVEQDEQDEGLRAILNFGHTVGHALEAATQYRAYRHGEAVALGMASACLIGEEAGVTRAEDTAAVLGLLRAASFETRLSSRIALDDLLGLLAWDKKSVGGAARFVLMEEIGRVSPGHVVPETLIRRALARQQEL